MEAAEEVITQFIKGSQNERVSGSVVIQDYVSSSKSSSVRGSVEGSIPVELPSLNKITDAVINDSKYRN